MKAQVIYRETVIWKEPGGTHHKAIVHFGDILDVIEGWEYNSRTWKDKRFVKVLFGNTIGFVSVNAISPYKENDHVTNHSNKKRPIGEESWDLEGNSIR